MNYDQILHKLTLAESDWEPLLNYEAQFLPKPKELEAFLKKAKPAPKISELEALVEIETLIKICLHHQKKRVFPPV